MLVKNRPSYIEAEKVSKPSKSGIRVITEMSTTRILAFVAYKHRVGLLSMGTLSFGGFIVWDKVVRLFI